MAELKNWILTLAFLKLGLKTQIETFKTAKANILSFCPHFHFTLPTFLLLSCTQKSSDGNEFVRKFDLFSKVFQNTVVIDLKF